MLQLGLCPSLAFWPWVSITSLRLFLPTYEMGINTVMIHGKVPSTNGLSINLVESDLFNTYIQNS